MLYRIQDELKRISLSLNGGTLTERQWCEMYAVQQALTWVLDDRIAALPFNVVMDDIIQAPTKYLATTDIPAN